MVNPATAAAFLPSADGWTAIFTGILAGTAIVALIYAARQLSQAHDAEKMHHLINLLEQFEREPMASYRKKTAEGRCKGVAYPDEAHNILNFFEEVALLVRRDYLDVEDVWSMFGYWMFNVYADFREDIEQEQRNDTTYYDGFCQLVEQLRLIEAKHGCTDDRPSKEDIKEFWRDEVKSMVGSPPRKRVRGRTRAKPKGQNLVLSPIASTPSAADEL
jgi:hypothetical protein